VYGGGSSASTHLGAGAAENQSDAELSQQLREATMKEMPPEPRRWAVFLVM
jgi:hypothetical protein